MSYQEDVYTTLTTDSRIAALVGDRVWADVADASTAAPYIVFQTITTGGETAHDGGRDVEFPLIQFSAWANTKAEAVQLGNTINTVLEGQTLLGYSGVSFRYSDRRGQHDGKTNLFGEILDYIGASKLN